jgi:hypothetical protein
LRLSAACKGLVFGFAAVLWASLSAPLYAQSNNVLGASVSVVGGLDTSPQLFSSEKSQPFYSVYPALSLTSQRGRSRLDATYSFGWNRVGTTLLADSKSHAASVKLSSQLGARWSLDLGTSLSVSDDIQTFYALRGVALVEESLVYFFAPVGANQTFLTSSSNVAVTRAFSERSSLTISGEQSFRKYDSKSLSTSLADQRSSTAGATYSRRFNERTQWSLEYRGTYHHFAGFESAFANLVRTGLTHQLHRNTTARFTIGPSWLTTPGSGQTLASYDANASLEQKIKENNFQFSVTQDFGNVNGLGSISKTRSASLHFSRALGRRITIFADGTGFESSSIRDNSLDNSLDSKGVSVTGNIGFSLTPKLSIHGGAQYQRHRSSVLYELTQTRAFASLNYSLPNLYRW